MVRSKMSEIDLSCDSFRREYESPEIRTAILLFEGVVCASHDDFEFDEEEDL